MSKQKKHIKKNHDNLAKFLYDYLPIIVFFGYYHFSKHPEKLLFATLAMLAVTFVAIVISYILTNKIPKVATFSASILGFFCSLSILFKDDYFIKIKPTIINLIFAFTLFYGYFTKKLFLAFILGEQIKMRDADWQILSRRWAIFFVALAILNEIIWRNFTTDFWVQFKVFGMMTISMAFTISQLPFILRAQNRFLNNQ